MLRDIGTLEKPLHKALDPVLIPPSSRGTKDEVLSIRVNSQAMAFIEDELSKLGLDTSRKRQNFYRGAILAGIGNAKRAHSPAWKKFIAVIQPQARKHLGMGLELDGAEAIMESGSQD